MQSKHASHEPAFVSQRGCWPFSGFEHSEAKQLLYPRSMYVWHLVHHGILKHEGEKNVYNWLQCVCAVKRTPFIVDHTSHLIFPWEIDDLTVSIPPRQIKFHKYLVVRSKAESLDGVQLVQRERRMEQGLVVLLQVPWWTRTSYFMLSTKQPEKKPTAKSSCCHLTLNPRCHL